jgi:hypothetical protein
MNLTSHRFSLGVATHLLICAEIGRIFPSLTEELDLEVYLKKSGLTIGHVISCNILCFPLFSSVVLSECHDFTTK